MRWLKVGAVIFSAVLITALGIDAADTLSGSRSTLLGQVISHAEPPVCPPGMSEVPLASTFTCVDTFEASPSLECPVAELHNELQTQQNANNAACAPESKSGVMPWRFVSFMQAQQLCARSGKRLPTNEEWHQAISGLSDDTSCVVNADNSGPALTGSTDCVAPTGAYDMVGNVWEWVEEEVVNGNYNNRMLPASGYVAAVDTSGIAVETVQTGVDEFGSDYAWTSDSGVRGMIRGGFYGSGDDAGIFAQNMSVPLDAHTAGIGFRCVK